MLWVMPFQLLLPLHWEVMQLRILLLLLLLLLLGVWLLFHVAGDGQLSTVHQLQQTSIQAGVNKVKVLRAMHVPV
jgi:hypothetical protein